MRGPRTTSMALVMGGIVSVQVGAAFATSLFDEIGPGGAVALRIVLAALLLLAIWRPALRLPAEGARRDVLLLGIALFAMNFSFYASIDRIPLGIAVTLEFIGPLGVALAGSRRRIDLVWVALAAAGLVLLAPTPESGLDPVGVALALVAGAFWATYILLQARMGRALEGGGGLALAMGVAALISLPVGAVSGGSDLVDAEVLAVGLGIAVLSSAIPYSLELEALRRLPASTFGVLMSLEPAFAAAVGFVGLGQDLDASEVVAIGLVLTASAGALREAGSPRPVEV